MAPGAGPNRLNLFGMHPAKLQKRLSEAVGAHRAGQLERAEALYRKVLDKSPGHPEALYMLAALRLHQGRPESALKLIDRAIARIGRRPELLTNRSTALLALERYEAAARDASELAGAMPGAFGAWFNLGLAQAGLEDWSAAEQSLARALQINPHDINCRLEWLIAVARNAPDRLPEIPAVVLEQARQLLPALTRLIAALTANDADESADRLALDIADRLAASSPPAALDWVRRLEQAPAAITAARVAEALSDRLEGERDLRLFLAVNLLTRGLADQACRVYETLLERHPDYWQAHSNWLIARQHLPEATGQALAEVHKQWAAAHAPEPAPPRPQRAGNILRIGWISPRLLSGPMESFFAAVLEAFPRNGVEHWLYQTHPATDQATARFAAAADRLIRLDGNDEDGLVEQISADRLDVAVDLTGHGPHHVLRAFARRLAPVQVSWLDYFHPTGIDAIDYFLTDRALSPELDPKPNTRMIPLPRGRLCYTPPDGCPEPGDLRRGPLRLACFNRLAKISDPLLDCWVQIMQALPDAELELRCLQYDDPQIRREFAQRAAARGLPMGRVQLIGWASHLDVLAAYRDIDLALDTFPFSGCATSADALWMGVPVITLAGQTMVGRQTASLLEFAGFPEWVAADQSDYVSRANRLAGSIDQWRQRRQDIRQQVAATIGRVEEFSEDLEQLLLRLEPLTDEQAD